MCNVYILKLLLKHFKTVIHLETQDSRLKNQIVLKHMLLTQIINVISVKFFLGNSVPLTKNKVYWSLKFSFVSELS